MTFSGLIFSRFFIFPIYSFFLIMLLVPLDLVCGFPDEMAVVLRTEEYTAKMYVRYKKKNYCNVCVIFIVISMSSPSPNRPKKMVSLTQYFAT
jgi:hypothetical protein